MERKSREPDPIKWAVLGAVSINIIISLLIAVINIIDISYGTSGTNINSFPEALEYGLTGWCLQMTLPIVLAGAASPQIINRFLIIIVVFVFQWGVFTALIYFLSKRKFSSPVLQRKFVMIFAIGYPLVNLGVTYGAGMVVALANILRFGL